MRCAPPLLVVFVLALAGCGRAPGARSGNEPQNYAARAAELEATATQEVAAAQARLAIEDATPPAANAAEPPLENQEITPVDGL